jgi:hypothetical protein
MRMPRETGDTPMRMRTIHGNNNNNETAEDIISVISAIDMDVYM